MQATATRAFFDDVGRRYEEGFGHDEGLIEFVKKALGYLQCGPETTVLDVGQGTGKPTSRLVADAGCKVYGVDLSATMVELARKNVPGGTFEVANMLEYSPAKPFDAVFANFSHFQFQSSDMAALAGKYAAWVKPGGHLFVGTMAADDFPEGLFKPDSPDGTMGRVVRKFMGVDSSLLVVTRAGWETLLRRNGFDVLHTEMVPFEAPPEAECDREPHYYIACRRVES